MKKISIAFILVFFVCLLASDIEVISLDPILELKNIGKGLINPSFGIILKLKDAIINTIVFAICGLFLGVVGGVLLSPLYRYRPIKYLLTFIRSIHEVFWAFLLMPIVGLNPVCGILAIGIPYIAIFSKRYYEIFSDSDLRLYSILLRDKGFINSIVYGGVSVSFKEFKAFTSYRLECAIKSSAVLGFIGLPTLGYHLESYFNQGNYSEAFVILFLLYVIVGSKKFWVKKYSIVPLVVISILILDKNVNSVSANIERFFTTDIAPWPVRKSGFLVSGGEFPFKELLVWMRELIINEVLPGLKDTVVVTQISIVASGLLALIGIFFSSKINQNFYVSKISRGLLIILRTTPEYILAYIGVQVFGPSMLPGIIALALHNSSVVNKLTLKNCDKIEIPIGFSKKKISRYFYFLTPQFIKPLLGNLFYRWEVMVRESSLLGLLGIYTLGFFVDSAITEDRMDRAIFIIIFIGLFNILIDSLSRRVRKSL